MPESYGKRQRSQVKARKAAAREERRLDRNRRQADRAAGISPERPREGPPSDQIEDDSAAAPDQAEGPTGTEPEQG